MALTCIYGGCECDGCMDCYDQDDQDDQEEERREGAMKSDRLKDLIIEQAIELQRLKEELKTTRESKEFWLNAYMQATRPQKKGSEVDESGHSKTD